LSKLSCMPNVHDDLHIEKKDLDEVFQYIEGYWPKLIRYHPKDLKTLIGLPNSYIVPTDSEIFQEQYYWDSYLIVRALINNPKYSHIAIGMVENLFYMIERFGIIPNASRFYFLSRSQPPLLSSMVLIIYDKIKDMAEQEVETACFMGGAVPQSFAPFNINQELVRAFQADKTLNLKEFLLSKAVSWVGPDLAEDLVKVWYHSDEAFRSFPIPIWIYAAWSVWYRLMIRPIVPNIEKISEADRAYYENFLLATTHNRTRIDFRYDVGFDLVDPAHASFCVSVMDRDLMPEIEKALKLLESMSGRAKTGEAKACVTDQHDRMRALKSWYRTQRNVTAWVAGVHGYLDSNDAKEKKECRDLLHSMVLDEIQNAKELLRLWETAKTNWMIVSGVGETTFMYYKNFGELVKRKIELMQGHENDEPYVDPEFQWRVPGLTSPVTA